MADRWMIRGAEFTNCNCAWGCPCQFGAKSTHGHCETVMCGHIEEGNFNNTNLDGLDWAVLMGPGPAPDRFLVGLAVLNLLSDAAELQPLLCVVDDEQWLDRASAQVLGFVARRLVAESVGMVFAARVPSSDIAGLPDLIVEGLPEADARALLDSALTGPLDTRVREQILAETHGNPLALLELPRGLTPQQLAGGFGLLDAMASHLDTALAMLFLSGAHPRNEHMPSRRRG